MKIKKTVRDVLILTFLAFVGWILWPLLRAVFQQATRPVITELMTLPASDIDLARLRRAADEAAAFVEKEMPRVKNRPDKFALFETSLSAVDPKLNGMFCEFGVYQGETINFIAGKISKTIHGFDSFEGLPEDWRADFTRGAFKMNGLPKVRGNVVLHKGWFNESLPGFRKEHPEPLAFAHMDADLYSSTRTVFEMLADRFVAGTVIQFDEFFNYPAWKEGESKAFLEFCAARHCGLQYLGYVPTSEQIAVKILTIDAAPGPVVTP